MCYFLLIILAEIWSTVHAESCVDYQGRPVEAGQNYTPNKLLPCVECLCISGVGVRCGLPLCLGQVNCGLARWNTTNCCNKKCLDLRTHFTDRGYDGSQIWLSRPDSRPQFYGGAGVNDESVSKFNAQRYNSDDNAQMAYGDDNVTSASTSVSHAQNLPSPYYPILIGLISCAPVALCIICVNAVRKYFALRSQFPTSSGPSFFPTRRRNLRSRGRAAESRSQQPGVFTEPPPSYKDLGSTKYRLSEDLPRYEDVIKHEQASEPKIFATTSSAQFVPPERVNFAFSVVDEASVRSPAVVPAAAPNPLPLTAAPPTMARRHTVIPDVHEGTDNPAHEP